MTGDDVEQLVRHALTGAPQPAGSAARGGDPLALLGEAAAIATSRRDRQVIAVAHAHLNGDLELRDALARDHLADFPDCVVVAWIAR